MLALLSALCCKALAYRPALIPVLVIVGHQRTAFSVSLRFPFFPQGVITSIMLTAMLCSMLIASWPDVEAGVHGPSAASVV